MCAHVRVCAHMHTRVGVQQGWCGELRSKDTELSGKPEASAPFSLPQPVLCEQPSTVYPQAVSFLLPCNKSKLLSKDNGGTVVLFILQQRGKADSTGIYLTLWLSRGLIFINELILPNNSSFIRNTHNVCSSEKGTEAAAKAAGDTWDSPGGAIEDPLLPGADEAT